MIVNKENGVNLIFNMYHDSLKGEQLYILDSNVVVNMEKAYYQPQNMNRDKLRSTLEFHKHVKDKKIKIDFSHALSELSISLEATELNSKKYYRTRRAVNQINKMNPNRLSKHTRYKKNESYSYKNKSDKDFIDSIYNSINSTSKMLGMSYLPMLKFYQLVNEYGLKKKETIYKEILTYMDETIGAISLYEIAAITYFLFTSNEEFNNAQSLMKVNNKIDIVKKAWNVSWDMTMLRLINDLSARIKSGDNIGDTFNRVLATNDKALTNIAEAFICDSKSNFNGKYVSNVTIDVNQISKKYQDFYLSTYNTFNTDEKIVARKSKLENVNPESYILKLARVSEKLTKEVIK